MGIHGLNMSALLPSYPPEIRTLANNAGKDKATNKTQKDERLQECGILSALLRCAKGAKGVGSQLSGW